MDMPRNEDSFEAEKTNEVTVNNYKSSAMTSDWQFTSSKENAMEYYFSSVSMVDTFCPTIWDLHANSQHISLSEFNAGKRPCISNTQGFEITNLVPPTTAIERALGCMDWTSNSMVKEGTFHPTASAMFPHSLSHLPADSGFIERAARFSCFSTGNFGNVPKALGISESLVSHARGVAPLLGWQDAVGGHKFKAMSTVLSQKSKVNMEDGSKDASLDSHHGACGGSHMKDNNTIESSRKHQNEAKEGNDLTGNESDEAGFSGRGGQEKPSMLEGTGRESSSTERLGSKKRKRNGRHNNVINQIDEAQQSPGDASKVDTEIQHKEFQNQCSTENKPNEKTGKQASLASDSPKQEYIHIRARRGQATNSHSLAERIRREKISERMKFLQDLVPGCSKVTGKAVMLDEIINYVQSLQRQIEFLSMKLATVDPHLNINTEGLLAKDIIQSQAGPSSLGFPPNMTMTYPSTHPPQPVLVHSGITRMVRSPEAFQRTVNSPLAAMPGGYKLTNPQAPNAWEDELHNVVQMGFKSSPPLHSQDLTGSQPPGNEN